MTPTLPYRSDTSVVLPTAVRQWSNGQYPDDLLKPCGLRQFTMVEPAASAMRSMVSAAAGDGITLSATGTWRSYSQQVQLFESRYVTRNTGGPSKVWNGVRYWKLPNVATAAVPGTSNHGFGLAVDLSNSPTIPIGRTALEWLADHGPSFGFWNTVRSEVWHWSYCLGDAAPSGIVPVADQANVDAATAATDIDWAALAATGGLDSIEPEGEVLLGHRGFTVAAVQRRLRVAGLDVALDGEFGPLTESAVRKYQRHVGLADDGRVGANTWSALRQEGSADAPRMTGLRATPETAGTASEVAEYVVQPGDGFLRIAYRTLWSSTPASATEVAEANGLVLTSTIVPGQVLLVPGCRHVTATAGDDWATVAHRLGVDEHALRTANAWQGDTVRPGMVVFGGRSEASVS